MFFIISTLFVWLLSDQIFKHFRKEKSSIQKHELLTQIPKGFSSFGIDISHHQGKIDWEELLIDNDMDSIISFVYCKATEGEDLTDKKWKYNRASLLNLQKIHGAYHFFTQSNPAKQAENFINNWKVRYGDLPPVLDVEIDFPSDKELISSMKIWLKIVEEHSGMKPVIYCNLHFYNTKFKEEFKDHLFWIAAYTRTPDCINDKRIIHWQFSDQGQIPSLKGRIDLNVSKIGYLSH